MAFHLWELWYGEAPKRLNTRTGLAAQSEAWRWISDGLSIGIP